ncbi:FHA domain-containing protein [Cardiosporidium cionae]|uniref:FHA domain-containing protein n=1 Tax=Cardiosporidium cionae TaxID=476202 RepID=A0ABQ7J533_9APIC|nr:FHA domain-containing protein [Cardiosporidium cionae]|eukprot:KAF8819102.1 FHA domain-containing protein [Cardiosporidium cionae]
MATVSRRGIFGQLAGKIPHVNLKSRRCIYLQATTWESDSHGLFDYEAANVHRKSFKINCRRDSYCILRDGSTVSILHENDAVNYLGSQSEAVVLLKLCSDGDAFYIFSGSALANDRRHTIELKRTNEKLWLVVRSAENGVRITNGDVMKLGRYKLHVKEAVTSAEEPQLASWDPHLCNDNDDCETVAPDGEIPVVTDAENGSNPFPTSEFFPTSTEKEDLSVGYSVKDSNIEGSGTLAHLTKFNGEPQLEKCTSTDLQVANLQKISSHHSGCVDGCGTQCCRICLSNYMEFGNPMVSPCKCKGSMEFVHLKCLRTWMMGRLNIQNGNLDATVSFFWRTLDCELCKTAYPTFVNAASKKIELLSIPRPSAPYLIVEPTVTNGHGMHIICLANKKSARFGRGHGSDVRLSDISVSRFHATIRYHKNQFMLKDQCSKFGTLVEIKRGFKLENFNSGLALQIGRTVISIRIKRNWKLLQLCGSSVDSREQDINSYDPPDSVISEEAFRVLSRANQNSPQTQWWHSLQSDWNQSVLADSDTPTGSHSRLRGRANALF